jgi:hypothetical protein
MPLHFFYISLGALSKERRNPRKSSQYIYTFLCAALHNVGVGTRGGVMLVKADLIIQPW